MSYSFSATGQRAVGELWPACCSLLLLLFVSFARIFVVFISVSFFLLVLQLVHICLHKQVWGGGNVAGCCTLLARCFQHACHAFTRGTWIPLHTMCIHCCRCPIVAAGDQCMLKYSPSELLEWVCLALGCEQAAHESVAALAHIAQFGAE
jgi:hypothetical protein